MKPPERIVVGVDGSPAGRAAAQWAAAEAGRRGCPLTVIHAYEWWRPGTRMALGGEYAASFRERAESIVDAAIAEVLESQPGLDVRGEAVHAQPARALIGASVGATRVVVGSRGRGGFASLLLGSVSQQVATHAAAPVVVVRGRREVSGGPVVVGVDGSETAHRALAMAFDEAGLRGCGVVAVRVYAPPSPPWGTDAAPFVEDWYERRDAERAMLVDEVAPWQDKYPAVPVEPVAVDGQPAEVLTGMSPTAQLIVVGTRGHGGFTGLLLGSVGLQLLHHAESPVLIARGSDGVRAEAG